MSNNISVRTNYRHDLDFLKSIAIVSVVLYHLLELLNISYGKNLHFFDGGFLGVDIFLVISGYLVLSSVHKQLSCNSFSLKAFFVKRLLRIYPPLLFLIVVCLIIGYFILFPNVYRELAIEGINSLTLSSNIRFANSGGYFALDNSDKPLLHTWYIALLLQFYLISPIIYLALYKYTKNYSSLCFILFTLLLTLVAIIFSNTEKSYLLTQCRIFELFIGGSIYLIKDDIKSLLKLNNNVLSSIVFLISLFIILFSFFSVSLSNSYWEVSTSLPTIIATSLIIICDNSNSGICNTKFNKFGVASYSIYLIHWPLLVFSIKIDLLSDILHISFCIFLILSLSYLSYKFIEKKYIHPLLTCISIISVIVIGTYIKNNHGDNYLKQFMIESTVNRVNASQKVFYEKNNQKIVILGSDINQTPRTFIIGDSHALQYLDYFCNSYKGSIYFTVNEATMAYGPVFKDMKYKYLNITEKERSNFYDVYSYMLKKLPKGSDVIIANNYYLYYKPYLAEHKVKDSKEEFNKFIKDMISDLDSVISMHPEFSFNLVSQGIYTTFAISKCTETDLTNSFLKHILDQSKCYETNDYIYDERILINKALKDYALSKENVFYIDRNIPLAINNDSVKPTFITVNKDHKPLFRDNHHYTALGGKIVGDFIINNLRKNSE